MINKLNSTDKSVLSKGKYKEKENKILRLFITKKKLIRKFAEEMAYLQIRADWWFYVASGDKEENQNMSYCLQWSIGYEGDSFQGYYYHKMRESDKWLGYSYEV